MEVEITSEELVKPSFPTPQHLRIFKLSLLDQITPYPHAPVILFYPANSEPGHLLDVRHKIDLLKKSLSRTMARFYPLAGKIRDGLCVECDDEGARFVEAGVNMSLTQFLADPGHVLLKKLIPRELKVGDPFELAHLVNIQVNVFQCGGLAVAMCNTHKLHDGNGLGQFFKEWAAFAQGGGGSASSTAVVAQDLGVAAELFPANDLALRDLTVATFGSMRRKENCATRRFLFSGSAIEALKARAKGSTMKNPTRVEAVSAFLWKSAMVAFEKKNGGHRRASSLMHAVNIRRRMNPPLAESSLGNLLLAAVAYSENISRRANDAFPSLVGQIREAISVIDGDLLSEISRNPSLIHSSIEALSGLGSSDAVDYILCSSWCWFGFYDTDFGWGRPIWVSTVGSPGIPFINIIVLVDTRSGDGIEAWVTLDEQEMALLQEDPELLSFTSVNPSPLMISNKP